MPALNITITDAGRAEMISGSHTSLNPLEITEVALGTGTGATDPSDTALQNETKRLASIAGLVVADDMLHVTVKDESADTYDVTEFGLFTGSGTLFAVYSQASNIMQKATSSTLLLSVDIAIDTLDANSLSFGDVTFTNPPASETVKGVAKVATQETTDTGENDSEFITALKLANKLLNYAAAGHSHASERDPGEVGIYAMPAVPSGWLACNGAAISRTSYAALFANIGTTFGSGNGSTTFNIPDLRGEFIRGWDNGRGVDSGRALGNWQDDEFKSHNHSFSAGVSDNGSNLNKVDANSPSTGTRTTNSTGGSETRPRNVALALCIKY